MLQPRYLWRQLNPQQRAELLEWRKLRRHPWHSPPNRPNFGRLNFHISAACYEHLPHIGITTSRMDEFSAELLDLLLSRGALVHAWCVLPNHYHALVQSRDILGLLSDLGRLHGRTSHRWNGQEQTRGRQVFHRVAERAIRSDRHFWATMNYVHNNPVHHGYVNLWTEWPWNSAGAFLEKLGRDEAEKIWRKYPLFDFGAKWDPPEF